MNKIFLLISFLLLNSPALCYIIQSDTLFSVLDFIPQTTDRNGILVIFDIDNCLAETERELGSDQWFFHEIDMYVQMGWQRAEVIKRLLPLYYLIQEHTALTLAEPAIPQLIVQLKKLGVHVIALTSRGFELMNRTIAQLSALGIDFADSSFFENYQSKVYRGKDGIIFCDGKPKDVGLLEAFEHTHYFPYLVVYADDKEKYLFCVGDMLYKNKINFYGIRYSRLDEKVAGFDPAVADKQLQEFYRVHNIQAPWIPERLYSKVAF